MADRSRRYRYGAYTGGPDPLAPPFDVRDAVDAIGERVLAGDSLREALRDAVRRSTSEHRGLDDLHALARRRRQELLRSGRLDGSLTRARALLDQALSQERDTLQSRPDDDLDAHFATARLDALPRSTAAAVSELADYQWASPEAKELYDQILQQLREEMLDQQFAGLADSLRHGADPGAADAMRELLTALTSLLQHHEAGLDTAAEFDDFMARFGEALGSEATTVEELIDELARRAAAAARLMASLRPEQRAELGQLMQQALQSSGLSDQMSRFSDALLSLRPDVGEQSGRRVTGETPLGYAEGSGILGEISDLEDLLEAFSREPGEGAHTLDAVDVDQVERALGRGAADDLRRLADLERALRSQGWVTSTAEGMTLSPKALRRLGGTALRRAFAGLDGARRGQHDVRSAGAAGEPTGASRSWQLGDTQPIDVVRTVSNAIRRSVAEPRADGSVSLTVDDFAVAETERRAGVAVALCVDLSFSMAVEGRWGPMKQMALALAHLVATQYPSDALEIVGFGRHAKKLTTADLAAIEPDYQQGTNLAHALSLALRHLRRHPGYEPVVLVVTDGEPTAHLDPDGEAWFNWPPDPETIRATVREVDALARYAAVLNIFMLGQDEGLRRFVDAMARRSGGRVFSPELDDLGAMVIDDYVRSRRVPR